MKLRESEGVPRKSQLIDFAITFVCLFLTALEGGIGHHIWVSFRNLMMIGESCFCLVFADHFKQFKIFLYSKQIF